MKKRVVIIGNSLSGNALALLLLSDGHEVYLFGPETNGLRGSIGEHLPPEALPLLQRLGIEILLEDPAHLRSPGLVSWWFGTCSTKDYAFSAGGDGYNLDRRVFDACLRAEADKAGLRRFVGVTLPKVHRSAGGWCFRPSPPLSDAAVEADVVVDASGRQAVFSRRMGAQRHFQDNLIAIVGRYSGPDHGDARLIVETSVNGWWYALRQTHGRRVAVYVTDAKQANSAIRENLWRREHSAAQHLHTFGIPNDADVTAWDARSMVLVPQAGPGWFAVGDAAMAFDPLSAAGITKALSDACAVSALISNDGPSEREAIERLLTERRKRWRGYLLGIRENFGNPPPAAGSWWFERSIWAAGAASADPSGLGD